MCVSCTTYEYKPVLVLLSACARKRKTFSAPLFSQTTTVCLVHLFRYCLDMAMRGLTLSVGLHSKKVTYRLPNFLKLCCGKIDLL